MLQLKDEIYNFRLLLAESMYETWFRFKKKLRMVPHHQIPSFNLLEIFYKSLNVSFRGMEDTISGGALKRLCCDTSQEILDDIFVTNRG